MSCASPPSEGKRDPIVKGITTKEDVRRRELLKGIRSKHPNPLLKKV